MSLSPLAQRILTAAVLIAALLPAFLLLPKGFGRALISVFVLGAAWEWAAFVGWRAPLQRLGYVATVAALLVAVRLVVPATIPVAAVAVVALGWWTVAFVLILYFPVAIGRAAAWFAGLLVMIPAWASLVAVLDTPAHGRKLLLVLLAIVWAADVGAYFAGRRFGRVKLAPQVSPGKTWEGVIGGLALATAAVMAGAAQLGQAVMLAVPLGLSVAAVSVVGDLTVSVFKRNAGLKDSGSIFPGHGGVLDRVDSVTAAAPLYLLAAGWLGWLGS